VARISGIIVLGTALGICTGSGILSILNLWAANVLLGSNLSPVDGTILVLLPVGLRLLTAGLTGPAMQIAKLKPIDYLRV